MIMGSISKHSWVLGFIVGLCIAYFAYDNLIAIPALPADHPDRGWLWLTSDPEVIEYIQTWFRNFGIWVLAVAIFVIVISITGFRQGQRWAWYSLLYLPVHIGIQMFIWPWTIPVLSVLMLLTLAGLFLPLRIFFPASDS
jgi:hypothetical protein